MIRIKHIIFMSDITVESIYNFKGIIQILILMIIYVLCYQYYLFDKNVEIQSVFYIIFWGLLSYILNNIWFIKNKKVYNKNKTGLIITDPSEDLDDEIALYHLIKQTKNGIQKYSEIFIVFANGELNSKTSSAERMIHFKKLFPEFTSNEQVIGCTKFILITTDCLKYINNIHFDTFLQIAPLCGISPYFFKQNSFKTRIIMGDFSKPENSLNLKKSWKDDMTAELEFLEQEENMKSINTRYITTNLAREVLLSYNNINNLPRNMQTTILDKAFNMFIGRVPPQSPYCMNVTIDANLKTAKNYLGKDADDIIKKFKSENDLNDIISKCKKFINNMIYCDKKVIMENALVDICICVNIITKNVFKDSKFNINSLNNFEESKTNFIQHIINNKCDITPAYDLIAMILFLRPDINGNRFDEHSTCFFKYRLCDY